MIRSAGGLRFRVLQFRSVRGAAAFLAMASFLFAQDGEVAHFGTTVVASGFRGDIYHVHRWTSHLPKFEKMKPVGTIYTPVLNVPAQKFDAGFPGITNRYEWFGIDYKARFWVQNPGEYRFSLLADDAADLAIDGKLVIDNDGQHYPITKTGVVNLSAGMHNIHVPYYQGPRFQVALLLEVAGPGERSLHIFNTEDFKPPADAKDW